MTALCPAAMLMGALIPLAVKPLPLRVTCEIATVEFPVLESVKVCDAELLTSTLPKLSEPVLGASK